MPFVSTAIVLPPLVQASTPNRVVQERPEGEFDCVA